MTYFDGSRHLRRNAENILRYEGRSEESILMLYQRSEERKVATTLTGGFFKNPSWSADIDYLAIYRLDDGVDDRVSVNALCTHV